MRLPLAAMLLLTACSGRDTTTTGERAAAPLEPTVRDSAGVTVFEHPEGALDRAPLLVRDTLPFLTLTGGDDEDLTRARSVAFTSDGGLVYYDHAASSVVFLHPDGTTRRRIGRSGSGPGEFGPVAVSLTVLPGDSVVVTDPANARLTVLHADTGLVRVIRWQSMIRGSDYAVAGALVDGRWFVRPRTFGPSGTEALEPGRSGTAFVGALRIRADAVALDSMAALRIPPFVTSGYWFRGQREDGIGVEVFTLMPGAVVWGGDPVTWDNQDWELVRRDGGGAARAIYRVVNAVQVPPADTRDSLVASALREVEGLDDPSYRVAERREDARRSAQELQIAERISPFASIRTGAGRWLWVEQAVADWSDSTWVTALDGEGRLVGTIRLPASQRLLAITDDRVALREVDDDDLVTIRVYRLKKTR